jgi:hypothetical protein
MEGPAERHSEPLQTSHRRGRGCPRLHGIYVPVVFVCASMTLLTIVNTRVSLRTHGEGPLVYAWVKAKSAAGRRSNGSGRHLAASGWMTSMSPSKLPIYAPLSLRLPYSNPRPHVRHAWSYSTGSSVPRSTEPFVCLCTPLGSRRATGRGLPPWPLMCTHHRWRCVPEQPKKSATLARLPMYVNLNAHKYWSSSTWCCRRGHDALTCESSPLSSICGSIAGRSGW